MISLKLISVFVALLGTLLYYWFNLNVTYVTLTTTFGTIEGLVTKSRNGREYFSYMGIPYAIPPIGTRRFQPSVPFGSWTGIRDATKMSSICPQFVVFWQKLDGHEDCLYLNVYTPVKEKSSSNQNLLPVIVFIHGGHFMFGGADIYSAKYFMDEDVVVVTMNYRIGALGFLNTGPQARGNMGLKDQVLALKWVQSAISDFGGNPDSVTIMGESAGSASVNYHMMSPQSDGLFHRAISQSGTALCPWAFVENTNEQGKRLAKKVGCPVAPTESMMKCLTEIDVSKIIETQAEMKDTFHSHDAVFGPSIDYDAGGNDEKNIFLFEHPRDAAENEQMARIPWMLGVLPEEGCLRSVFIVNNQSLLNKLNQDWNEILPKALIYEKDNIISNQIKNYYFGQHQTELTATDYNQLTRMYSDRLFFECTSTAATLHAPNAPTFLYLLNYNSGRSIAFVELASQGNLPILFGALWNFVKLQLANWLGQEVVNYGVCHADDIQYFFSTFSIWEISTGSPHYEFSKELVKLWVSFAKNGSPDKFQNVAWEKVGDSSDSLKYMLLGTESKMIKDPFVNQVKFWKSLHI